MKKNKIYHINSFTSTLFEGNPAGVTSGKNLSPANMQLIAREMNLSETAFLSSSDSADFKLQWFTPTNEVRLCGHGTIAALHYLKEESLIKEHVTFETLSGILNCGFSNGKYFMQIPCYNMSPYNKNIGQLLSVLGLDNHTINNDLPPILLENGNLYLYIEDLETIKNCSPDFKALKQLTIDNAGFEGIVLFSKQTIEENSCAFIRYFVPAHGINEDPVTGSAIGPLPLVMQKLDLLEKGNFNLIIEQGDFMSRRGRVTVTYDGSNLFIAGSAITLFKGELKI
jgi:trans-2,3-dihydro-3-hydroxyanthranilate isomerase